MTRLHLLPLALAATICGAAAFVAAAPLERASAAYWAGLLFPVLLVSGAVYAYYAERVRTAAAVLLSIIGVSLLIVTISQDFR